VILVSGIASPLSVYLYLAFVIGYRLDHPMGNQPLDCLRLTGQVGEIDDLSHRERLPVGDPRQSA
jgi:hypothetical protein